MTPYLSSLTRKFHAIKPKPDRQLEQYAIDVGGVLRRARFVAENTRGGRGLIVGDDDLFSLFLLGFDGYALTLLERDRRIIDVLEEHAPEGAAFETIETDLRGAYDGSWPAPEGAPYDFFVTSPPYTFEGMTIFIATALRLLKVGGLGFIAAPHDATPKADEVTLHTQRFLLANGCLIERCEPAFSVEEGLPAYQIVVRKLEDVAEIDWVKPLTRKFYEYEVWSEDAYEHQIE